MNRLHAMRTAAGAALALFPHCAYAQASPRAIKLGAMLIEASAEAFYGIDTGIFNKHGLDVDLVTFTNGAASAAAIASGSIDVGIMDLATMINGHNRGLPFVYLAPGLIYRPADRSYGVVVPNDSPIREAKDFNGKTLAATALNNISILPVKAWIDNNGGDVRTIHWVEMPMGVMSNALSQSTVQGALISEPLLSPALERGNRVFYMENKPLTAAFLFGGWAATTTWVAANRGAADQFAAAMLETAKWANANFPSAAPILSKYSKIPLPMLQNMRHGQFAEALRPQLVDPVIVAAEKYGMSDRVFPATQVFFRS